jgi:hypothetical protein
LPRLACRSSSQLAIFPKRGAWDVSARADARVKPFPQMILWMDVVCEFALIRFSSMS